MFCNVLDICLDILQVVEVACAEEVDSFLRDVAGVDFEVFILAALQDGEGAVSCSCAYFKDDSARRSNS